MTIRLEFVEDGAVFQYSPEYDRCDRELDDLPDENDAGGLSAKRYLDSKRTRAVAWSMRDDSWGQQHDCTMLENGNILLFANGIHVPRGVFHSAVVEIDPRSKQEVWRYEDAPRWNFFSPNISGAQRLQSGNTLICEGLTGRLFEVTPDGETVWEYINPYFGPSGAGEANRVFRAYRYPAGAPELGGRL